jgi:hypothetical protein
MLKRRLSLRRRQIPERTEVTQQRLETAGRDCRARKFEECLDGGPQAAQVRSDIAEAQGELSLFSRLVLWCKCFRFLHGHTAFIFLRQVGHVHRNRRTVADLRRSVRSGAAADALDPILHMVLIVAVPGVSKINCTKADAFVAHGGVMASKPYLPG